MAAHTFKCIIVLSDTQTASHTHPPFRNLFLLFLNQNICCGYLKGPLNETGLLKTKNTLFNLLMRETSQFLCHERLLNMTYVAYKNAFFREMQFWSHCYTVVSYQALFRLSVYKIPAIYLSGAKMCVFARYATLIPRPFKSHILTVSIRMGKPIRIQRTGFPAKIAV